MSIRKRRIYFSVHPAWFSIPVCLGSFEEGEDMKCRDMISCFLTGYNSPDIEMMQVLPHAYIIYRPKTSATDEIISYTSTAYQILSFSIDRPPSTSDIHKEVSTLCAKWRTVLSKKSPGIRASHKADDVTPLFLDVYQSGRRSYLVKGLSLAGPQTPFPAEDRYYLFIIERMRSDFLNFSRIAREFNLSRREQDLVKLLLTDLGNKQIAHTLGLSLNTVKTYLKLLMRKLGVTSRAGIIAAIIHRMSQTSSQEKE